jgi:outer membrane protein assembly factor BamB
MKKTTLIAMLLCTMAGHSQNFEWVKTPPIVFNMNNDMIAYSTTTDAAGNVYFTGFKANPFPYEDIMGTQFFNKYSASGELLFSKEIVGNVNIDHITADSQGNLYMALGYVNTITIGQFTASTVNQGVNHLVVKFNSVGDMLWQQELLVDGFQANGFMSIAFDDSDNVYIAYDDYQNSYIRKMAPDGTTLVTIEQTNAARISSVSVDNEGNIYAAGSCVGPQSQFAGVATETEFGYNTYAVKYSPTGVFQWVKFVEDITCPAPIIIAKTPDAVYFSSQIYEMSQFDGIDTEGPSGSFEDMFIAKLNAGGDYQWVREVPGEGIMGVGHRIFLDLDAEGNVYFGGRTGGNINWGNGITTSSEDNVGDLLVLKYSPSGEILMAETAGGSSDDRVDCINIGPEGDIYISGMVRGNASFGSINTEAEDFQAYPFMAKMNQGALGNEDFIASGNVTVYPNPATDYFSVDIEGDAHGSIYNIVGQRIKDVVLNGNPVPVSELQNGIYILSIEGYDNIRFIKK